MLPGAHSAPPSPGVEAPASGSAPQDADRCVTAVQRTSIVKDTDRYDLDRDTSQIITFGAGRHHCLGVNLARLEARTALTEFVRSVESYEIDEAGAVRVHSSNVRGFAALPVRVKAR